MARPGVAVLLAALLLAAGCSGDSEGQPSLAEGEMVPANPLRVRQGMAVSRGVVGLGG
jgi:hypothetical protein